MTLHQFARSRLKCHGTVAQKRIFGCWAQGMAAPVHRQAVILPQNARPNSVYSLESCFCVLPAFCSVLKSMFKSDFNSLSSWSRHVAGSLLRRAGLLLYRPCFLAPVCCPSWTESHGQGRDSSISHLKRISLRLQGLAEGLSLFSKGTQTAISVM